MNGQQRGAQAGTAKEAAAHHAQDEGRTGVVAEEQRLLGLGPRQRPLVVEPPHGLGPHRVAADGPQKQRRGGGPRQMEERSHPAPGAAAQGPGRAQQDPELRQYKIGEETGQQRGKTELHRRPRRRCRRFRQQQQGCRRAQEQANRQTHLNPPHSTTSVFS